MRWRVHPPPQERAAGVHPSGRTPLDQKNRASPKYASCETNELVSNGWPLVGIGWILYGFGVAPAYYSWGFFLPEVMNELGLSRAQGGLIFSVLIFSGGAAGPFVGMAVTKWGIRVVIC